MKKERFGVASRVLLVDQLGTPLAIWITGANAHDKWSGKDLIVYVVAKRFYCGQYFCADRGYDFDDVHEIVSMQGYIEHIKHKRKRNQPEAECPIPGEKTFPARRRVVERMSARLTKRRSVAIRWCKKPQNCLAFVHMACADIVPSLISG